MTGQRSLFEELRGAAPATLELRPGAVVLRGFARAGASALLEELDGVCAAAPFRHMETPGGLRMSVAMTNCGTLGWISDRRGYRYAREDPLSGQPWPVMPPAFRSLASRAATAGGYPRFVPDACLVNRYAPGARLTPHQDKNEPDLDQPIVSVSLGLPAVFQFGGPRRTQPLVRILLEHGDTVVWGGASRHCYHGVLPLQDGEHPVTGQRRINLTFRRAG
ncbi:MAG TPA: DNA oxidative demethylase AlkB [Steroidobacteraceae bacterium]|nr:DNA oxidative demethylase AlkB [Steroidobacteraceae bacterium]